MTRYIAALILALLSSSSYASLTFIAELSGPKEAPPNASPGTGAATVIFDEVAHTMRVVVTFQDLTGTTTASHIHCCTAVAGTSTAGVATTTPTFTDFPLGVTSGNYDHTFDMTLSSSYNAPFITNNGGTTASAEAALLAGVEAGKAYLNIHSSTFAGGEIRGFLAPLPVPEPETYVLFGVGLVSLAFAARNRWKPR